MSLIQKLKTRAANNNPVRVGIIGAGKFGSMYLSQVPRTPGIHYSSCITVFRSSQAHHYGQCRS